MTKRYFYTDALAAAWMAKHFGMRFEGGSFELIGIIDEFEPTTFVWTTPYNLARACDQPIRAYIHPDDLDLLEPEDGDLITWEYPAGEFKERHSYEVITDGHNHNHFPENARRLIEETGAHIIMRGGIVFHWPESEEA
jgi:hypothetical protein